MKSGFLNKKSKHQGLGLLLDERSKKSNLLMRGFSTGGWENYKYEPETEQPCSDDIMDADVPTFEGPILPLSIGAPKNSLSVWYGRRHKDFIFCANDCFVAWHIGPDHERYFTCIFTCPSSGEKFMCGTFGDRSKLKITHEKVKGDDNSTVAVVWYRKKKDAENAAAARALDCFSYREGNGKKSMSYGLCAEPPYLENEIEFMVPIGAPDQVFDEIMTRPVIPKAEEDFEMDDDTALFRNNYRSMRGNQG